MGLGLIFVSVTAFRNVNQTPGEAVDRAFFNVVEKITERLVKIFLLPLDFLVACKDALVSILLFPFRMISSGASRAGKLGQTLLESARDWFLWLLYLPAQFLSSLLGGSEQILNTAYANLTDRLNRMWLALDIPIFGILFQKLEVLYSGTLHRLKMEWMFLNHRLSDKMLLAQNFGLQFTQELLMTCKTALESRVSGPMKTVKFRWMILNRQVSDKIIVVETFGERILQEVLPAWERVVGRVTKMQGRVAKVSMSLHQEGNKHSVTLSREYHSLNRNLAAFAIFVEEWIQRISGVDFRSK